MSQQEQWWLTSRLQRLRDSTSDSLDTDWFEKNVRLQEQLYYDSITVNAGSFKKYTSQKTHSSFCRNLRNILLKYREIPCNHYGVFIEKDYGENEYLIKTPSLFYAYFVICYLHNVGCTEFKKIYTVMAKKWHEIEDYVKTETDDWQRTKFVLMMEMHFHISGICFLSSELSFLKNAVEKYRDSFCITESKYLHLILAAEDEFVRKSIVKYHSESGNYLIQYLSKYQPKINCIEDKEVFQLLDEIDNITSIQYDLRGLEEYIKETNKKIDSFYKEFSAKIDKTSRNKVLYRDIAKEFLPFVLMRVIRGAGFSALINSFRFGLVYQVENFCECLVKEPPIYECVYDLMKNYDCDKQEISVINENFSVVTLTENQKHELKTNIDLIIWMLEHCYDYTDSFCNLYLESLPDISEDLDLEELK